MQKEEKKVQPYSDTIVAIATPAGTGGISIIRVSGAKALACVLPFLKNRKPSQKKLNLKDIQPRYAHLFTFKTKMLSDDVLVLYFKNPNSYTGEDVIEIQCHGNYLIAQKITQTLIETGCRAAYPGEFTKRAFLNSRIDLTQAEATIDLIQAKSTSSIQAAHAQLQGGILYPIGVITQQLLQTIAKASSAIDYPEDDIIETSIQEIIQALKPVKQQLQTLKDSYHKGALVRQGVRVAIVGKPNVGKSALLNRLLGFERAIVTDIAGTTRDTVEEHFTHNGILFVIIDTAGIRDTTDRVEQIGIQRSNVAIESANLIINVTDIHNPTDFVKVNPSTPVIDVVNKLDLAPNAPTLQSTKDTNSIYLSAKNGDHIQTLKDTMVEKTLGKIDASGASINTMRQFTAVTTALDSLNQIEDVSMHLSLDCVLSDLTEAHRALCSLTGVIATDEVINEIFAKFCVGK